MERTRAAPLASPMGRARSLIGVLVSVGVVGLGWGTLMPLIPVLLQREGVSEGWIGVNSAMPTLAVLTVGAAMGALLGRLGLARALFGSLGLIVVAILALHLFRDFWSSVLLRYVIGLGAGLHWILSETWVNSIAPPHRRGLVVGLYSTIYMSGFTIGPAALSQLDLDGPWSFLLIAGTTAVAGIALWLVRRDLPHVDPERATPSWEVLATGKPVFLAALGSGLIDSAAWSLVPVYALEMHTPAEVTLLLVSVFNAGTVATQIALGWLADRIGAAAVILACALAVAGCAMTLPYVFHVTWLAAVTLLLLGSAAGGLYAISLVALGVRFAGPTIAGANALFITLYSTGSLLGPPLAGFLMQTTSPEALPAFIVAVAVVLALALALSSAAPAIDRPR